MAHTCDALVVSCMDFRLQKFIRRFTDEQMTGKLFDYVAYAGASKSLDVIAEQVQLSKKLHNINELFLINHEDCGAYGAEGTKENHIKDLQKAKSALSQAIPDLNIHLYYLHLDGTFEKVSS